VTGPQGVPDPPDLRPRSPLGDFLFGALYLRGRHPFEFAELGRNAGESGFDIPSVLAWIDDAEASGLVERVSLPVTDGDEDVDPSRRRAVRLTSKGLEVARTNPRITPPPER